MSKQIFCIGGANIDVKLKASETLELATSNIASTAVTFGGVARNVAENLAVLTSKISLQCVVGDDASGQLLLKNLQTKGVDTSTSLILAGQTTSSYYAVLKDNGELHIALVDMAIYENLNFEAFISSWQSWPTGSIVFLDTNLPASLIEYAIQLSYEKQILLCIDPVSTIKAKRLPQQLHGVFLLKPNQLEASALTNTDVISADDCMRAAEKLLMRGAENVVISLGESGYVVANKHIQQHIAVTAIERIIDANGAGDAFISGILWGLQLNKNIIDACQLGSKLAALALQTHKTAIDSISRECLLEFTET